MIKRVFRILDKRYNCKSWWPVISENPFFEIIVGCILTQNTNWRNVEKVILNLKNENLLSPEAIIKTDNSKLKELIRTAGYYNQKVERLKEISRFLIKKKNLKNLTVEELRKELLSIKGIGPETADSIILYAFNKPSFIIDAYTKRIFSRLGIVSENISYDKLKELFERNLKKDVILYQRYHGCIVEHAKNICKKRPACQSCYIKNLCKTAKDF